VSLIDDQERLVRDFYNLVFAMGGAEVIAMFPSDLRRQRSEFGRALFQWVTADDPAYIMLPYCDRMDLAYAAADFAMCRAGALTCAELTAVGLPAAYTGG